MLRSRSYKMSVALAVIIVSSLCWGQKDSGSIVGAVKDASGAVVAGASLDEAMAQL